MSVQSRTFLMAGFTSVRDLGNGGRFGDVALRIARGVALVPTDIDSLSLTRYVERTKRPATPGLKRFMESSRERLRRAVAAGVKIVAGSDN